jgi:hypothetical protein
MKLTYVLRYALPRVLKTKFLSYIVYDFVICPITTKFFSSPWKYICTWLFVLYLSNVLVALRNMYLVICPISTKFFSSPWKYICTWLFVN